MNAKEILNLLFNHLDKDLRNNQSLIKIKETFLHILEDIDQICYVMVNENVFDLVKEFQSIATVVPIPYSETIIFQFSSHETHDIELTLRKLDDYYHVNLETSMQNIDESFDVVNINIVISDVTSTWNITEFTTNENDRYESYDYEIHSYNKNSEELELDNIDDIKDKNFSDYFGVPMELSRKYRLNFSKYKKEINDYFVQKEVKKLDDLYSKNTLFVSPFLISELSDYLLEDLCEDLMEDFEEDLAECLDEDQEFIPFNLVKDKANYIQRELIKRTGDKGLFTMSYNLYLNLTTFVILNNDILKTSGIILRKLNGFYTLYYVYLDNREIILMPKSLTNEEVKALYESSNSNKTIEGIPDFFNEGKKRKLKPNDN